MTTHTDRIMQMAREADAGIDSVLGIIRMSEEWLTRFAQLVAEDCARVAAGLASFDWESAASAHRIDQAIRARYSVKD